jgi:hypothetical protein
MSPSNSATASNPIWYVVPSIPKSDPIAAELLLSRFCCARGGLAAVTIPPVASFGAPDDLLA